MKIIDSQYGYPTTLTKIRSLAADCGVRVSLRREQGRRVIGLHGQLHNVQWVANHTSGYFVEQGDDGYYLYSTRIAWR
jgi:hypothetical protein